MFKRLWIVVGIAVCFTPAVTHADPRVSHIHRLCADMGLSPGAYDFLFCAQALAAFANVPPAAAAARDPGDANLHAYGDFRHANRNMLEQRACEGLGLDIGSQRFGECVDNLNNALSGF
ncbi:MAG TPA: hypothetical protein VGG12_07620 [Methylovirgula sp.]|jgi:hypothetical protein